MDFGRRRMLRVELLQRRLKDFSLPNTRAFAHCPSTIAHRPSVIGQRVARLSARQLNPLDHFPAADLEDLDDGAGGADLDTEGVAVAQPRARHLLLALLEGLDRAQ